MGEEACTANLPIIDLLAPDRLSTAATLRKACTEVGFFYIINHGVDKDLLRRLFEESKKFFSLPLEEKMKLERKEFRGYTALYSEKLDPSLKSKGDPKESFYIGPLHDEVCNLNRWPSEELLPNWRPTIEAYHREILNAGKSLLSLLALALNLDEKFFENVGALDPPMPFLRLLHYPGDLSSYNDDGLGASAHSDYGMITLLATDGVPGLQGKRSSATNLGGCSSYRGGDNCQHWGHDREVDKLFIQVNIAQSGAKGTRTIFCNPLLSSLLPIFFPLSVSNSA